MSTNVETKQEVEDFSLDDALENDAEEVVEQEQKTEPFSSKMLTKLSKIKSWLFEDYIDIDSDEGINKAYDELGKVLLENHIANACVEKDPSFLGTRKSAKSGNESLFFEIYKEQYKAYHVLVLGASLIDKYDMFIGPIEAGLILTGYDGAKKLACFSRIVQEFVKLPFAMYYLSKTNKLQDLGYWAASEAIAISSGLGRMIDIVPVYKMRVEKFIRDKICEKFIDTIIDNNGEYMEVKKNDIHTN